MKEDDFLSEEIRAEDILLGSLGFDGDAKIVSVEMVGEGYRGVGRWTDGEVFDFECEDKIDELQIWALGVVRARKLQAASKKPGC